MNDSLIADYLHKIIGLLSSVNVFSFGMCTSVTPVRPPEWELGCLKLRTATVPGGCTKLIQAADVTWNACLRSNISNYYDAWLSQPAAHEHTRSGNLKPPSCFLLCQWVKSAWEVVPVESVKKSFLSYAITIALDGKAEDGIHCFKPAQPCEARKVALQQEMVKFLSSDDDHDNSDPFTSDGDNDEVELAVAVDGGNRVLCIDGMPCRGYKSFPPYQPLPLLHLEEKHQSYIHTSWSISATHPFKKVR